MEHDRRDLRSFLAELEAAGELLRIDRPVDLHTQLPALCSETDRALLLMSIPGFPGMRVADGLLRNRRLQALALGCRAEEVIPFYASRLQRGPGRTVLIDEAPAQETVRAGTEASLEALPVPTPSEGIEVPHLGLVPQDFRTPVVSGAIAVTRDPDTGVQNCFFTMAKLAGARRLHCYVFSPHTLANIERYRARGERAPIALVIGCHPVYELVAAYTGPHEGFGELELIAGVLDGPLALTRCRSVDLAVPAYAEIVIEGLVDPRPGRYVHTSAHTDTYAPFVSEEPFVDVTAITARRDPVYRHIQPTRFTDHHAICEFIIAPTLYAQLRAKGLDVHDVAVPAHSCLNCAAVQMTPRVREEVREALLTGMAMPFFPRLTVAVDRDIDIYDANDLLYALSIRVDPARDLVVADGVRSFNLEPQSRPIPGLEGALLRAGARYGIDATRPPLAEPEQRLLFERLRARGEGRVRLADFTSGDA